MLRLWCAGVVSRLCSLVRVALCLCLPRLWRDCSVFVLRLCCALCGACVVSVVVFVIMPVSVFMVVPVFVCVALVM